jgi:hypothetical protein
MKAAPGAIEDGRMQKRIVYAMLVSLLVLPACQGEKGDKGDKGDRGEPGKAGPAGPEGESGILIVRGTGTIVCPAGLTAIALTCPGGGSLMQGADGTWAGICPPGVGGTLVCQ